MAVLATAPQAGFACFVWLIIICGKSAADDRCSGGIDRPLIVQYGCDSESSFRSCIDRQFFDDGQLLPLTDFQGSSSGAYPPVVAYPAAQANTYYTLLMVDRDAPNPNLPTAAPYLHWMIVNAHGLNLKSFDFEGDTKKVYAPPTPPAGIHRYVFMLFPQPGYLSDVPTPTQRQRFDIGEFQRTYGLLDCVADISFKTKPLARS